MNVDIPAGPTLPGSREHAAGGWGGRSLGRDTGIGAKVKALADGIRELLAVVGRRDIW